MFVVGSYNHTMEESGRFILPAKLREAIGSSFYLCLDMSNQTQLEGLDPELFKLKAEMVLQCGAENPEEMQRFFEFATPITVDKQGRTLIPEKIRKEAGLGTEIVIIGMMDRFIIKNNAAEKKVDAQKMREFNTKVSMLMNDEIKRRKTAGQES